MLKHCSDLNESNITIKSLDMMKKHSERFFQVLEVFAKAEDVALVKSCFTERTKQLAEYKEVNAVMAYVNNFLLKLPEQIG